MLSFACLLDDLIVGFCYSNLTLETGGLEITSTFTLVLQAKRLTKCASHPYRNGDIKRIGGIKPKELGTIKVLLGQGLMSSKIRFEKSVQEGEYLNLICSIL